MYLTLFSHHEHHVIYKKKSIASFFLGFALCGTGCFQETITLDFTATADLGEVWLIEDVNCFTCGNGMKRLGRTRGVIKTKRPAEHWYVELRVDRNANKLNTLNHPSHHKIESINLEQRAVTDQSLTHLTWPLRALNLSKTHITGQGLKHLKPHPKWTSISIEETPKLDPTSLKHLKTWTRLSIHSAKHKSTLKQTLCDNKPDPPCQIQLR